MDSKIYTSLLTESEKIENVHERILFSRFKQEYSDTQDHHELLVKWSYIIPALFGKVDIDKRDHIEEPTWEDETIVQDLKKQSSKTCGKNGQRHVYSHVNHFEKRIKIFLGLETTVNPEHLEKIKSHCYKGIYPCEVHKILVKLKLKQYYDNYMYIWHLITNNPLPDISDVYEKVINDFNTFYTEFNKISNKNRTSLPAHNFLLFQFLLHNNKLINVKYFNMPTNDALENINDICQIVYKSIGWKYDKIYL